MNDELDIPAPSADRVQCPATALRRATFFVAVAALTGYGVKLMLEVLRANGMTILEMAILGLFAVTFAWITLAFCTAATGFLLQLLRLDPLSLRRRASRDEASDLRIRTAVVMPVYNEAPERVLAGLEATMRDVQATGDGDAFDFYLLSDSTDAEIAAAEAHGCRALARRTAVPGRLFYRRRERNEGRKAGNLAEFCKRWGAYYEAMIVLDADSVMSGEAVTTLARALQANPSAGLIQTVPIPMGQHTLFGRLLQLAATLYSPMLATGLSFWQTDAANYWGHNAILRVRAFMRHCGLPTLSGKPPLGGEILSHDFVEAALMRRGGWHVYLFPELQGSYEELPSNALDFAKRDRRWAQGNLQHLRLLSAHGLHPLSRLHFAMGALAYGSSLLWLLMLVLGTVDALQRALGEADYFASAHQLFPSWPVSRTQEMYTLLGIVAGMLVLPKIMGVIVCLLDPNRRREFGGSVRTLLGATFELLFSVIIAPVMMTFHAFFVAAIVCGRNVRWNPQSRDGRSIGWREAFRNTWLASVTGLAWGAATATISPLFFWALTPVLAGLVLAAPVLVLSSRPDVGRFLQRHGWLLTPAETAPPAVVRRLRELLATSPKTVPPDAPGPMLLPDRPRSMRPQPLERGPRWDREPTAGRLRHAPHS